MTNRKKILFFILFLLLGLFLYPYLNFKEIKSSPTLYFNANIISMEKGIPQASCMLVEDGKILYIGTNKDSILHQRPSILVKNINGKTILPGFIDPHTHVALSSFLDVMIDLSGFRHSSNEAVWQYLSKEIQVSDMPVILGKGLDDILVPDLQKPNLTLLDSICPDKPLILFSQSLHHYWVNSKAFEAVGMDKNTPNPNKESYYEKDANGNLSGAIIEQAAFMPFASYLKSEVLTSKLLTDQTLKTLRNYALEGNTTVVSTGITIEESKPLLLYEYLAKTESNYLEKSLNALGFFPDKEALPRHFLYIRHDKNYLLPKDKSKNTDAYGILGIKHWYDGSPYTGSMYLDSTYLASQYTIEKMHLHVGHTGNALVHTDSLRAFIEQYSKKGWQIAIHAQGDRANKEVLEAFSQANETLAISTLRHRMEHGLLLDSTAVLKMRKYAITPSFHINHIYYYGKALKHDILGERTQKILPLKSFASAQIPFSLHADQPMFPSKPFHLMQTAIQRQTKEGDTIGFSQAITRYQALEALTTHAAYQIHMEDKVGSLRKGKYADFLVLDRNPLMVPIEKLREVQIEETYINGVKVQHP